jgi:NADPH-dependent 7-cyano-7-deazaguanine reductase QueF
MATELLIQPNTRSSVKTVLVHELDLPACCPVSGNPQPGSAIRISYKPDTCFLEVYALRKYIDSYRGGRGDVRDMEGMIQQIALDCAAAVGVPVTVVASIVLQRGDKMRIVVRA